MATYAIGDIHGCMRTLEALLEGIEYEPGVDRLWLTGDLVNRGPDSLEVLRWAREQGDSLICVLGNHEIHLLGAALESPGFRMRPAFEPIVDAPDGNELLAWVATRPLMYREAEWVVIHAGLLPHWSIDHALGLSARCEELLRSDGAVGLLSASKGTRHQEWSEGDPERGRLADFLQVVTLLRLVDEQGQMVPAWVDGPQRRPASSQPWFDAPKRPHGSARILFGPGGTLGLMLRADAMGLDSACVWGGKLTALRLEDGAVFQQGLLDDAPRRR